MRARLLTALSIATVALMALAASASAADRYVSPGAVGGIPDCITPATACDLASLNGSPNVAAGDVVHMLGGTYSAPIGLITKRVSILGPTSGPPATITRPLEIGLNPGAQPVRYEDFTVNAETSIDYKSAFSFSDAFGTGAATFDRLNLRLTGFETLSGYGLTIYFAEAAVTVRNSVATANDRLGGPSIGMLIESAWDGTAAVNVSNVTAVAVNAGLVLPRSHSSGGPCGSANITIRNSIIHATSPSDDPRSDIVAFPPSSGDCYPSVTSRHSNWRIVYPLDEAGRVTSIEDQRDVAPVFEDVDEGDFREADNSPTIDRGEASPELGLTDLLGAARVIGDGPDIGAYERTGGTYPWPVDPAPGGGPSPGVPGGGSAGSDKTAPVSGALKLSPSSFAATKNAKRGSKVSYTLSEAATVTWTVGLKQKKPKKGYKAVKGSIRQTGKAGPNTFQFLGYVGATKLKPGAYLLSGVAVDAAGNKSKVFSKAFTIKK